MDQDGRSKLYDFFAQEGKRFQSYVRGRIESIGDMDAEDIVAEVMLKMCVKADASSPVENLAAYVYRALHNKAVDYRRKSGRTLSLESCMDEEGELRFLDCISDFNAGVSGEVGRKELMRRLSDAISSLEPRQRAVFVATEMKGMSFRELSSQWHEPIGTLLSRKSRAVKALQQMLKDFKAEVDFKGDYEDG